MVTIVAVALVARASDAAELRPALNTSARWSSNASGGGRGSEEGEQRDVRLDAGARFNLASDPGRFSWRIGYAPVYERFVEISELDNWRHRAYGGFQYDLGRATRLGGNAEFSRSTRTNLEQELDDVAPAPEPTLEETDEEIDRGELGLELSHAFGPRWSGNTSARYSFTDYNRADRSDFEGASALASLIYTMTARQSLGGGVSFSRQIVKEADLRTASGEISTQAEQETRFASLFGSWIYQLSPLWRLDLRAGPTFIDSDLQDTRGSLRVPRVPSLAFELPTDPPSFVQFPFDASECSRTPCEQTDILPDPLPANFQNPEVELDASDLVDQGSSNTVFANFGIARRGESSRLSLNYSRSEGQNYGGRTSTISDVLSGGWNWRPDADWSFDFGASYAKQQQATSVSVFDGFPLVRNAGVVPGLADDAAIRDLGPDGRARIFTREADDAFDVDSWAVRLRATRRLTRRLSGFLGMSYLDQTNNGVEGGVADDLDRFEVGLGLTYAFDPLRL